MSLDSRLPFRELPQLRRMLRAVRDAMDPRPEPATRPRSVVGVGGGGRPTHTTSKYKRSAYFGDTGIINQKVY